MAGPGAGKHHADAIAAQPAAGGKSPDDPDATYCRPPQKPTDSRLLGPPVCIDQRQWEALHAQGLDISADGRGMAASEKYHTLHNGLCHTRQDDCF